MLRETTSVELEAPPPSRATRINSADREIQAQESTWSQTRTQPEVRRNHAIVVILQLTAVTFLTSITTGLITVSIPHIAVELAIQPQLYYWCVNSLYPR